MASYEPLAMRNMDGSEVATQPITPVTVRFKDITLTLSVRQDAPFAAVRPRMKKKVLHGISGEMRPGTFVAIMGGSGSGKTSTMDVLLGRSNGEVAGSVTYNNQVLRSTALSRVAGYVMQDDLLHAHLTVRETLQYAALFRLSRHLSYEQKMERVESVIRELNLESCADNRIGGGIQKGISGGERRRVSIGVQLILNPSVLFLDEPTSGLDSHTALSIAKALKRVAAGTHSGTPRTVVATIHQPRSDLLPMFDSIMILAGGSLVYNGPTNDLVPYFEGLGVSFPQFCNPLDVAIDACTSDIRLGSEMGERNAGEDRLTMLKDAYLRHAKTAELLTSGENEPPLALTRERSSNICTKTYWLTHRWYRTVFRDRSAITVRIMSLIGFAILVSVFLPRLKKDQRSIQNRTGLLYQCLAPTMVVGAMNAMAVFPPHRNIYYREAKDHMYSSTSFAVARFLVELPWILLSTGLFCTYIYWVEGLNPIFTHFLVFFSVILVLHLWGEAFGSFILCFIYNSTSASNVATMVLMVASLTASGLLRTVGSMPLVYQWFAYVTPQKYGAEILAVNEYTTCWEYGCPVRFTCTGGLCPFRNGDEYLRAIYPHAVDHIYMNVGIILGLLLVVNVMLIAALSLKSFRS